MAKGTSKFDIKEMSLEQAQTKLSRVRGRGSKYDPIVESAEKLKAGNALVIEGMTTSEVTGVRQQVRTKLGDSWTVRSASTKDGFYRVVIYKEDAA